MSGEDEDMVEYNCHNEVDQNDGFSEITHLGTCKNGTILSLNKLKRNLRQIENDLTPRERAEVAQQMLRDHKNLDLDDYDKHIMVFKRYSDKVFNFETVFTQNLKAKIA